VLLNEDDSRTFLDTRKGEHLQEGGLVNLEQTQPLFVEAMAFIKRVALASAGLEAANHWLVAQDIALWTAVRLDPAVLAFSVAAFFVYRTHKAGSTTAGSVGVAKNSSVRYQ